jgi:hypothetical protein
MLWPSGGGGGCLAGFPVKEGALKHGVLGQSFCCSSCKVIKSMFGCKASVTYLSKKLILLSSFYLLCGVKMNMLFLLLILWQHYR